MCQDSHGSYKVSTEEEQKNTKEAGSCFWDGINNDTPLDEHRLRWLSHLGPYVDLSLAQVNSLKARRDLHMAAKDGGMYIVTEDIWAL